jgi:DNA mismatch endonuclease (patch repair protein)
MDASGTTSFGEVSPGVRRSMQSNRRTDTKPEKRLRSALHRRGRRFRKDVPVQAGERIVRVDIAFMRQKVAVFVDGCFWHSCPDHRSQPKKNGTFWRAKLEGNVRRDQAVNAALRDAGWRVIRIWEHESVAEGVAQVDGLLGGIEQQDRSCA